MLIEILKEFIWKSTRIVNVPGYAIVQCMARQGDPKLERLLESRREALAEKMNRVQIRRRIARSYQVKEERSAK